MAQDSRPCKGCGATIYREVPVAPIRHYCSPDCRPRCSVEACTKPVHAHGMCNSHSERAKRLGDPLAPLMRLANHGSCSVEGCEAPMRKNQVCVSHASVLRRSGEIRPFHHRWADEPNCLVCGRPNGAFYGSRQYCSGTCKLIARKVGYGPYDPGQPASLPLNAWQLAERDGPFCQLCGCDVDMDARRPDQMCPSVDHIVPLSRGGQNAAHNLQLAHLACNRSKGNRSNASLLREVTP